jgi:asparagine synthase (glutamine-hydrolysing)
MGCFVAAFARDGAPIGGGLLHALMDVSPFGEARVWSSGPIALGVAPLCTPHSRGLVTPLRSGQGRLSAVMDGRLDGRADLAARLGPRVRERVEDLSDVELLLASFERWGTRCVEHLLGDFAFCVWDADQRQLFCARDQLGVKPLYYAQAGGVVLVSNVLRSVRRHSGVSDRLDDLAIGDLLLFSACMDPSRTSFADIARVPPAHTLTCSVENPPACRRYWSLEPGDELRLPDPREYVERHSSVLETAVRDRLGNGSVGMLMSGGLDSSSVAATAAQVLGADGASGVMRAYTLVYDTAEEDEERRYSSLVADRLRIGIEHHPADGYDWFERWDRDLLPPEPCAEPMTAMTADLLERVSRHAAVALTGDGGDPLLLPATVVSLLGSRSLVGLARDVWRSTRRTHALPPIGIRSGVREWLSPRTGVPDWLAPPFIRRFNPHARVTEVSRQRAPARGPRGVAASAVIDPWWTSMFETYDPGATRRPVELRYPLFDLRVISLALTLPTHPWCVNKEIVRSAMRGRLPDEICDRPKSPLAVDVVRAHGCVTMKDIAKAIESAPELAAYIDLPAFTATLDPDGLLTADEPGTWAAMALATWFRCAASSSVAA